MSIIWTICIGFIIGLIARALVPGKDEAGFIITTALGVSGALISSLIGHAFGLYGENQPASFAMSVIGAVALLVGYRYIVPTEMKDKFS
jgi:uncharacterized membrane protein YeaQ/YmgE (transglycosylase-associated protein family)